MKPARSLILTAAAALTVAAIAPAPGDAHHRDKMVRGGHHGDGWKKVKHDKYGSIRYVTVRQQRAFILRPAREDRFLVHRGRAIVVRPVPYWSVPYRPAVAVGVRTENLQVDLAFRDRQAYYGCNFCEAYYPSYVVWRRHVVVCSHRPRVRIICEPWEDDDPDYFYEPASFACSKYDDDWDDWEADDDDDEDEENDD